MNIRKRWKKAAQTVTATASAAAGFALGPVGAASLTSVGASTWNAWTLGTMPGPAVHIPTDDESKLIVALRLGQIPPEAVSRWLIEAELFKQNAEVKA